MCSTMWTGSSKLIFLILSFNVVYLNTTASNEDSTVVQTAENRTVFPDQWLTLPLDHFNLFDNRTWQMRYLVNRQFYKSGGPIFIEIGGEWTIGISSISIPQIQKLARKHSGIYFATEHRYYGKSLPFSKDFSKQNLKYLQIEQALEDLAFFIEHIKSADPNIKDSKVIVHGCSYGGMLATWMRSRFPHLVDISYSSSSPITLGLEYPGYYEVINEVYANVTVSCIETIKKGLNTTIRLLETRDGRKMVKNALEGWTCGNIFWMHPFQIIMEMIGVLNVQSDALHYEEVSCLALMMDADDMSAFERLTNLVVLKSRDRGTCRGDGSPNEKSEDRRNDMGWIYQVCTQLGSFQTISSDNPNHPFELDINKEEFLKTCRRSLGKGFTEELLQTGIERMNRRYGGRNIKVTKLLSAQGNHDPLKRLGMRKAINSEVETVILNGSHCIDVVERESDTEELTEGRKRIRNIISDWIEEISKG